ncbi:MAG: hypothetical protein VX777_06130 [Chlamydiota bacterium]|nr:hypothetical protein [Chlamydiota bacterium]
MITNSTDAKLDFFFRVNELFAKGRKVKSSKISELLDISFKLLTPSTQITGSFTLEELKKRVNENNITFHVKRRCFNRGNNYTVLSKVDVKAVEKGVVKDVKNYRSICLFRDIFEKITVDLDGLEYKNSIFSVLDSNENDLIDSINDYVCCKLAKNLSFNEFTETCASLKINGALSCKMLDKMSRSDLCKIIDKLANFNIDSLDKLTTFLGNKQDFDAESSVKMFSHLHNLTYSQIVSAWDKVGQNFNLIAVLNDKKLLDESVSKLVIEKCVTVKSYGHRIIQLDFLWEALSILEIDEQYPLIDQLIKSGEARWVPIKFFTDQPHKQSKLKEIATGIFEVSPHQITNFLHLMNITDEKFLEEMITKALAKGILFQKVFDKFDIRSQSIRENIVTMYAKYDSYFDCELLKKIKLCEKSENYRQILLELAKKNAHNFLKQCDSLQVPKGLLAKILLEASEHSFILNALDTVNVDWTLEERITVFKNNLNIYTCDAVRFLKNLKIDNLELVAFLIHYALDKWMATNDENRNSFFWSLSYCKIEGIDYYQFFKRITFEWQQEEVFESLNNDFPAECKRRVFLDLIDRSKKEEMCNYSCDFLKLTSNCPEIRKNLIIKAAGIPTFNISKALEGVKVSSKLYKEIARLEVVGNPKCFVECVRNHQSHCKKTVYQLMNTALKNVESIDSFIPPELENDLQREDIYQLAKLQCEKEGLNLTILGHYKFDDPWIRYKYAQEIVSKSDFDVNFLFIDALEELNLKSEHLVEIFVSLADKFNSGIDKIELYSSYGKIFKQMSEKHIHLCLGKLANLVDNPRDFPFSFSDLNVKFQATVFDAYTVKNGHPSAFFVKEFSNKNIKALYCKLLELIKLKPESINELNLTILSPERLNELVEVFYQSVMKQSYTCTNLKILDVIIHFFEGEKLCKVIKKIMYDNLIKSRHWKFSDLIESKLSTNSLINEMEFANGYFSRSNILNNFAENYSFDSCKLLLPESLHTELEGIELTTSDSTLKEKLVVLLLDFANHYYFNEVFQVNYRKNRYVRKILHQIIKIRSPDLKKKMLKICFESFFNQSNSARDRLILFKRLCEDKKIKDKAILANLHICSYFPTLGKDELLEVAYVISAKKSLINDRINFTLFMEKFEALLASKKIEKSKVFAIVCYTIHQYDVKEIIQRLSLINAVVMLEGGDNIDSECSFDVDERLYINNIKNRLEFDEYDNGEFIQLFRKNFESYRDKFAIVKYIASQISKNPEHDESDDELSEEISEEVEHVNSLYFLKMHMQDIFSKKYKEQRYSLENSPHLKKVFQQRSSTFQIWQENYHTEAFELFNAYELETKHEKINFFDQFRQWILEDKHIPEKDMHLKFPVLNRILLNQKLPKLEIVNEALNELRGKVVPSYEIQNVKFQIKALKLLIDDQSVLKNLKGLKSEIAFEYEFKRNITNLIKIMQIKKHVNIGNCIAEITDTPESLLMMGSDCGTCQRVDGSPKLNRGLMGVFNGKYKLVTIRDKDSGKIYARTLLKVLLNKETNEGVLFMERIYTNAADPRLKLGIRKLCLSHAKKMRMPLLQSSSRGRKYPNSIYSEVDRFNIEYVDALGGVQVGGYTIEDCVYVE